MQFSANHKEHTQVLVDLFETTFSASEGAEEGKLIASLATDLLRGTDDGDIFVFSLWEDTAPVGCVIFTRLSYDADTRKVFILSPVAIAPNHQGKGLGQELLRFGLTQIQKHGVDVVATYGSPDYYAKVGFKQVTTDVMQPPQNLSMPFGWLAQSLDGGDLKPLKGDSRCVLGLNKPVYW